MQNAKCKMQNYWRKLKVIRRDTAKPFRQTCGLPPFLKGTAVCPYCNTSSNLVVSVRRTANGRPYDALKVFVNLSPLKGEMSKFPKEF